MPIGSLWLLRAAAAITWGIALVGWLGMSSPHDGLDELTARFLPLALALPALLWLVGPRVTVGRRSYTVLALVMVIAAFHTPDLLYPAAAVLPLVLPARRAALWLAVTDAVSLPWLWYQVVSDPVASGLTAHPSLAAYAGLLGAHIGWQLFAFAIGLVAATERRQRRDTARLNAELVATQGLLAASARIAHQRELSRELHDALGHHLAALGLQLELAHGLATGRARDAVDEARGAARELATNVRGAVGALRTRDAVDLHAALTTIAHGTPEPRVHVAFEPGLAIADPARAHALFRCGQEAITNAIRHAGARQVWLEVARAHGGIELTVRDDGRGQPALRPGQGLRGMRERLEALGGRLELATATGAGFTVTGWLPPEDAP